MRKLLVCLVALLSAFVPQTMDAQILYGSLVGNVVDATDAAIPGALVTITNKQTGAVRTTLTNDQGGYSIPTIQNGLYTVRVTKDGFRTAQQDTVEITVNNVTRADFKLTVGQVSESITVEAQTVGLQTDRAEVKTEIATKVLTEVPVPGQRNYQALLITVPGISPPGTPHSVPSNPSRAMNFSTNGANTASNNTRIDGASATNIWLPHISSYVPALESIETVNVVTNTFDAEQGLAGGASINVIIRSGTNELHGAGFWYHSGNWSQSRNFFLPSNQDIPKFVFNQPGGRIGGPIVKNKLFYFASYEATFNRQFAGALLSVPTPPMRLGDLSASSTVIYDPRSGAQDGTGRTPFAGNRIPPDRIHPLSARLMRLLPQENVPNPAGLPTQNYFANSNFLFDRHTIDSKVNYNITDRWTAYARLSWLTYDMVAGTRFPNEIGGGPIAGGNPGTGFGGTWSGSVSSTYSVSPRFIIDGNFGYTLMDTNVEQPGLGTNICRDDWRIPGTNGTRRFESGMCGMGISGFEAFGSTENYMPYFRRDPQYQYVLNFNWLKGSHNIRWGMDIYHLQLNHTQPEFTGGGSASAAGRLNFGQGPTQARIGATTTPGSNYNAMATYLLGLVTDGGRLLQVPDEYTTRTTQYSFYIRDQWTVNRKLTLSYGTRLEMFPMPRRKDRGMERYDFNTNEMLVCGVGGIPKDCGTSAGNVYWSPRLGIAYRASDKTVIRTGFGINWDPWNLARPLRTNYPILAAQNVVAPTALGWATTFDQGLPPIPAPVVGSNGRIAMPSNYALTTTDDEFTRGYMMNWNFTIQRDLGAGFILQTGYVASRSLKVSGILDRNAGQIVGADRAGQPLFGRFNRAVSTGLVDAVGRTQYDSLQVQLNRRFSGGFQMNTAYTWSKTIGICCNEDNNGGPRIQAMDYFGLNRAPLGFDRTHNLQINAVWELPFGKGRAFGSNNAFVSAVLGGWQLNTLTSFMTGTPFTVTSDGGSLRLPGSGQQADQIKREVKRLGGIGRGVPYYDFTAFARVTEARFGTAGINSLRGPNFFNSDLGLFRTFAFSERWNLQFRAEYFNWTNTPKFANPSSGINNLQTNPDGSFRTGVFEITGTQSGGREPNGDRILRLGLRLSF